MKKHFSEDCAKILNLFDLILIIIAKNERGFLKLEITKTKFRARMNNDIMKIRMSYAPPPTHTHTRCEGLWTLRDSARSGLDTSGLRDYFILDTSGLCSGHFGTLIWALRDFGTLSILDTSGLFPFWTLRDFGTLFLS